MKHLTTIQKFAVVAIALALFGGRTALAQLGPSPETDKVRIELEQKLSDANSALVKVEMALSGTKRELNRAWAEVQQIEQELSSKNPPRDARFRLGVILSRVDQLEKSARSVATFIPTVQKELKGIGSVAYRYGFYDIFRLTNLAVSVSEDLAEQANTDVNSAMKLRAKINLILSRMR